MKKTLLILCGIAALAGCNNQRKGPPVDSIANEICTSVKNFSKQAFISRQKGADKDAMLDIVRQQSNKEGVFPETIEMVKYVIRDAFTYGEIPENQWQQQATEYSEKHYKLCLERF